MEQKVVELMPAILYVMWIMFVGIPVAGIMVSNRHIAKMAKER